MDFYDEFSQYENDVNRLDEVKRMMDKEGLIKDYKNRKTGITPTGFKICFEGGYLEEKNRKERQIRQTFQKQKREIGSLKKKIKSKSRINIIMVILLIAALILILLMSLGIVDLNLV